MDQNSILGLINDNVYGIWFLVGAALVFFMQCGFAMVEAGFTRAKNAGNIIMKNLMDFCLGTVVFILIGFGLLCGEDLVGIIGKPGFDIFSDYANFDWSSFVFNLVFCATAATIVSGAMAERTKFISYCIYSAVISAVIYPVETHWVWGGGWLSQLSTPFHDFAGSGVIHMVGGISALIGAAILGPRIGKFTKTKDGKDSKKDSEKKDKKSDKKSSESSSKSDTGSAAAKKSAEAPVQQSGFNPLAIVGVAAGVIGLAVIGVSVFTKRR